MDILIFIFSLILAESCHHVVVASDADTLELIQLFVRHGNRTGEVVGIPEYETWYIDTFQPFQGGNLLPPGRRQVVGVGEYMRQQYNSFLPDEFSYSEVTVRCAATNRVQETAAIVMGTMFPPKTKQRWQDSGLGAIWTPIPCESVPADQDTVLDPSMVQCPRFDTLENAYLNSKYFLDVYSALTVNGTVSQYIENSLNTTIELNPKLYSNLFDHFSAMEDMKIAFPAWAEKVWPNPVVQILVYEFVGVYYNQEVILFGAGEFLKEILDVATRLENGTLPKSRKLFAYFGHDKTIYSFLAALGFEKFVPLLDFGASVIMELHRNKTTSEIGYKFLYRNNPFEEPIIYTVPGCQEICPLWYVKDYLSPYIPTKPFHDYCVER